MKTKSTLPSPHRITDLINEKKKGQAVTCNPTFEILPVDFLHRKNPYKAYIFLCLFNGKIGEWDYSFRKCYARGCPQNQCVHVSRAIMIANRYLQRDYSRLVKAGIKVEQRLFTLEDMLLKFDSYEQDHDTTLTLEDCLRLAKDGEKVNLYVDLQYVPAVEHFSNYENSQTFLTADFTVDTVHRHVTFHRCLSCYQTDKEQEEKAVGIEVANARLKVLYRKLAKNKVNYTAGFFQ
jgi:hypothetical protein